MTTRRIGASVIAVVCLVGVLDIFRSVSHGQSAILLIFAVFMAITGLICIGAALNFNNIMSVKKQSVGKQQKITKGTNMGAIVTGIAILWLVFSVIGLLLSNNFDILRIIENLALPVVFIILGMSIKK